jgi:DNA-binding sugar fermentation-stimulating protein
MAGKFVLQVVGITEATILHRPSLKCPDVNVLSDVLITKDNKEVLAHTPSMGCDGLAETDACVFVALCPPEEDELSIATNGEQFTHTVFLSKFKESEENEQIIGINPNVAMEIMESAIEKNLMKILPPVKQFKRNVPMRLEGKVDSAFSFVGICNDNIPFIMEVNNVPFAEYNHGQPDACRYAPSPDYDYNSKSAYFPEKNTNTTDMIKRIQELTTIASESSVRCIIGYVVERTDIDKFEISLYDDDYRMAVKKAVECGVYIMPIVVGWTNRGNAIFVTDELPIVKPQ